MSIELKTEMFAVIGGMRPDSPTNKDSDWAHDAAFAHALLQAMDEHADPMTYWIGHAPIEGFKQWLVRRAKTIMLEWGFNDEH